MTTLQIDFPTVIAKFDTFLARGLCAGVGRPDGQMCIEAAITQALGLPFNDDPECVARSVREYKIRLNDSVCWLSSESRAKGLRALGIAQIGSRGVVDDAEFTRRLAEKTIRGLIPALFRQLYPGKWTNEVDECERTGSRIAVLALKKAVYAAYAATDAADAAAVYAAAAAADAAVAYAAADAAAAYAAYAAIDAADAATDAAAAYAADAATDAAAAAGEPFLLLSASLALETLRELKSPGCEWV